MYKTVWNISEFSKDIHGNIERMHRPPGMPEDIAGNNFPDLVLDITDTEIHEKPGMGKIRILKRAILITFLIAAAGSLLLGINLYEELPLMVKLMAIGLFFGPFMISTDERCPVPAQLWFYPDRLVLYHERVQYSRKLSRRMYDMFLYDEIKNTTWNPSTKKLCIYGIVRGVWYDLDEDGAAPDTPSYDKTTDSIRYLYLTFSPDNMEKHILDNLPKRVRPKGF